MNPLDSALAALRRNALVVLASPDHAAVVAALPTLEQHDTFFAGPLRILDGPTGPVLAEQDPATGSGLLRPAASLADARRLVAERLATYERMWDGCGCKVDYFTAAGTSGVVVVSGAGGESGSGEPGSGRSSSSSSSGSSGASGSGGSSARR